jgi:RNase adapter protein RapZ
MADLVVDTSGYSALDTRLRFKKLAESYSTRMTVSLISFGFKHGTPLDVDTLLDVRFLPNPHYDPELRPLTGHDAPVREAVLGSADCKEFLEKTSELFSFLIPRYAAEGKTYFTVGIGYTAPSPSPRSWPNVSRTKTQESTSSSGTGTWRGNNP